MTHVTQVLVLPANPITPGTTISIFAYAQADWFDLGYDVEYYIGRSPSGPWTLIAHNSGLFSVLGTPWIEPVPTRTMSESDIGVWYIGARNTTESGTAPRIFVAVNVHDPTLPETSGNISVSSVPSGAAITIDGVGKGSTPSNNIVLPIGQHELSLALSGYVSVVDTINVQHASTLQKNYVLAREGGDIMSWLQTNWMYVAVGAGGIAVAYLLYRKYGGRFK